MMLLLLAAAACLPVDGDSIRMSDVARGAPAFAAADPAVLVALAPAFGATRTLASAELVKLAARHGVELASPPGLCFERPSRRLDAAELKEALARALPGQETRIEIVDFAGYAVPAGRVNFPAGGLQRFAAKEGTRLWRGSVEYGNRRSYPVWAKVRLHCRRSMVVATSTLPAGAVIRAADLRIEERDADPGGAPSASRLDEVAGKVARSRVAAGEPVPLRALSSPPLIQRGEEIQVTVQSGQARLRLTARAQRAGRAGETIPVRNPQSGRIFPARVEGQGQAVAEGGKR